MTLPELLIEKASVLDNLYVATRYLNGHAEGAPFDIMGRYKVRKPCAMPVRSLNSPVLKWPHRSTFERTLRV